MQVNSVTSYNNQLQNRSNVKFGDCKKIVCEEAMIKAKKAFENSSWKKSIDLLYDYEVHFMSDTSPQLPKGNQYMMIIKPSEQLSMVTKKVSGADSTAENLPTTIFIEANSLEDNYRTTIYDGIRNFHKRVYEVEQGLITRIKNLDEEYIFRCINNATKRSEIVRVERTTRK